MGDGGISETSPTCIGTYPTRLYASKAASVKEPATAITYAL
jgi:hypothetical protein